MLHRDFPLAHGAQNVGIWISLAIALLCPLHLRQTPWAVKFSCPYWNTWYARRPFCSSRYKWFIDYLEVYHTHFLYSRRHEENAYQWTWPGFLQTILICLPPPRPRTEDFRLYGRSVSQNISSLSVRSNCDKILLPTKHNLHKVLKCRLSLWHVWSQGCEQYVHHKTSFSIQNLERAGYFPLLVPCIDSDWLSSQFFCLFDSFHPFCWNHHFGIQSDEMCILPSKRIAYTFKWSYGILDTSKISLLLDVSRPWYLWEKDLIANYLPYSLSSVRTTSDHAIIQ